MSQPVNLGNKTYDRLKFVKEAGKHGSFSKAVDDLIDGYWSPQMEQIQIEEGFQKLMTWLRARDLLEERAEGLMMHAKAKVMERRKEKVLERGKRGTI